jgi:RNA polymerase sigma factor (sigma-70 family)
MGGPNEGAFSPREVESLLTGELRETVRITVLSVAHGRPCDREGLVAEVFSELAVRMLSGKFAGHDPARASMKTYIGAAARNIAIDILRGRCRTVSLEDIEGFEPSADGRIGRSAPWDNLVEEEQRRILHEALDRFEEVDPRGAGILKDLFFEEISYDEIARKLGVEKVEIVHLWAHRARASFRKMLRKTAVLVG